MQKKKKNCKNINTQTFLPGNHSFQEGCQLAAQKHCHLAFWYLLRADISQHISHFTTTAHLWCLISSPLRCRWRLALEEPSFPPSLPNTQGQHHVHTCWCWSTSFHAQTLLAVQLPEDPRALFEYRGDTECKATNAKGYRVCFHIPPYSSSSQTKPSLHLANVLQAAPLGNAATSSCSQYSHDHQPEIRWYSVPIQGYHARPEGDCFLFFNNPSSISMLFLNPKSVSFQFFARKWDSSS